MGILRVWLPYFLVLPVSSQIERGGLWAWMGLAVTFGIHPLLDRFRSRGLVVSSEPSVWIHRLATLAVVGIYPLVLFVQVRALERHASSDWDLAWWGSVVSIGLMGGAFGITAAHELVHRKSRALRAVGVGLLALVNNAHFRVEHVFGHHKTVATPEDPASARRGESLFRFVPRSIAGAYVNAWRLENRRLKGKARIEFFIRHRCVHYAAVGFVHSIAVWYRWGVAGVLFWYFQSLVAMALLEAVNYIEHYGLVRVRRSNGDYEPATEKHSWDCDYALTNDALFMLGYHAHHHRSPMVPYERLSGAPNSPKMPFGYTLMILMALIPALWFRVMDRRLPQRTECA